MKGEDIMDKKTFESRMIQADTFKKLSDKPDEEVKKIKEG